ncbi:hypothetical protein Zmor_010752 [Zophobas morio]|uniref:Uncharacterized protein n=1 Tax=Zophobas morio TaxID=2755281 RepID=A0AA38IP92_9CUCU|nr:hypothetical protein Zmor_010752 [Zophobas morio]
MVDAWTQTVPNSIQPFVILEDILQEKRDNKKEKQKLPCQSGNQSTSYRVFVRPIARKENASSTRLSLDEDYLSPKSIPASIQRKRDRPKRMKPGPLCYKQRIQNKANLKIPVVMSEMVGSPPLRNLETILERPSEHTPECNLRVDSVEEIELSSREIATQTNNNCEDVQITSEEVINNQEIVNCSLRNNVEDLFNSVPDNIRFQLEGITTVVSTNRTKGKNNNEGSSEEEQTESEDEGQQKREYIKIQANTVHIHNHFYSSS